MFSAPDKTLALTGLLLAAMLAPGCARSSRESRRPFADVTDAERNQATVAVEPAKSDPVVSADEQAAAQVPPAEQPPIVPPTEPIRAETPTAGGPATTSVTTGPERYQIIAPVPAIIEFGTPVGGPDRTEIPMTIDEVGLVRQWPLMVSERPSGNVVAGPTYWRTDFRERRRGELAQAFVEPVEFLWNTLLLPYRMVRTPPRTSVEYDPATERDEPRVGYETEAMPSDQQEGQLPQGQQE